MNPILYVLYYFFKLLVWSATSVYYAKVTVVGERHHRSRNPCILVSNHPSTMLDPLNVAIVVDAEIKFLANAGLFKNPVAAWLLRQLYCIPVERYQDTGGKPLNNAASFEQASNYLATGGCLFVAPEGNSFVERRLRKIKTGTARIAFDAESRHNWQLGLTIQPVGLDYSDPTKFRSELLKVFGKPIRVADFREDYEADPVNGVHCLTEAIGEHIGALIIDCEDGQQDQLLYRVEAILRTEKPLPPLEKLRRSQTVLSRLRHWKASDVTGYEAFSTQIFDYFEKTKSLKITDLQIAKQPEKGGLAKLVATLPFCLPGYLTHVLPCFFAKKITNALNADYHWIPTYKFTAGVVMYPLFIGLQTWLVGKLAVYFGCGDWVKWAYLAAVIPLGLVTEWWLKKARNWQRWRRAAFLRTSNRTEWDALTNLRQAIVQKLVSLGQF